MALYRRLAFAVVFSGLFASAAGVSIAAQIDLRLDVDYAGGAPGGGGVWTLFARSDSQGVFSLRAPVAGIDNAVMNELPRGRVNGAAIDNAGFAVFANQPAAGGGRDLFFAQQLLPQSIPQQGLFYGVGTLASGAPNYPGRPGGTAAIGPNLTTLTALQNVPWAASDPVWPTGVEVASGTFSPGAQPSFGAGPLEGFLFSSIGSASTPGSTVAADTFTTAVETNLAFGVATGDYNGNGVVDAADYTLWRDTRGQSVAPLTGADGTGDGEIDLQDYAIWQSGFGDSAPSAAEAIPEPNAVGLLLSCATLLAGKSRVFREIRHANQRRRPAA
ncbi:MAG: hypothetical protein AAF805_01265 [Planctomycetota bacterium]